MIAVKGIKNIILVASGKGGVGKSTVASNLAVALARDGFSTGLLDADLYGPSVPLNMGIADENMGIAMQGDKEMLTPINSYGVKVVSLGFLMKKEDAVIWRGPMATNALKQLIENTVWGDLEYLVIDMPPGTGDICITIANDLPHAKALIVVTPQQIAIADGRKAATMFNKNGIDIEILGVVENMSWFTPETHPDEKYFLFGKGGGEQLAKELNVPLLAQIPLVSDVCDLSDNGKTIFASTSPVVVKEFEGLMSKVVEKVSKVTYKMSK